MTFDIICLVSPRRNVLHHLARLQLDQVVWNRLVTVPKEAVLQRQVFSILVPGIQPYGEQQFPCNLMPKIVLTLHAAMEVEGQEV